MNTIKKTIAALGLAAATYGSIGKASADQTTVCDIRPNSTPYLPPLRRGDTFVQRGPNQTYAGAVRQRFRNRELSDRAVERIVAEGLRNTQRNYHLDPCLNDALIIPSYVFNRPRNPGNNNYGLTQEDRNRIHESYERIRLTQEGLGNVEREVNQLEGRVNQVGQDLNDFRDEMADDNSVIMNKLSNRTREIVHVETNRTIRDQELRDRRQRAAEMQRQLTRDRDNTASVGYGWMDESINGKPYAAGQTINLSLYGNANLNNDWAAFLQADGKLDFLQEFDSERNIRSFNFNANAGLRRNINPNVGIEAYADIDSLSAVIFDNAGDMSVNQNSLGLGAGLRLDFDRINANLGIAYGIGNNDTTMESNDGLTRLVLDASASFQPNLITSPLPIGGNLRYRLESTNLDAEGEDRSSIQHEIDLEALYFPKIVPGLGAGLQIRETIRDSEANDESSTTVGGVVRYNW